jgi:hypothetical protein
VTALHRDNGAPVWLAPACARLEADPFAGQAEPALAARWGRARSELLSRHRAADLPEFVLSGATTPFIALVDALAVDLGVEPADPRLLDIGEGTLLAYLQVRLQDDVVDEPAAWDRGFVYLVDQLACMSVLAFARAFGPRPAAPFLAFRARVLAAFVAAAVGELDRQDTGKPLERERIGAKFLPLATCLGALACAADRADVLDELVTIVRALGEGLQLANDLLNVAEDERGARPTGPLQELVASSGAPVAPVRLSLLASPVLERTLDDARAALARAEDAAGRASLTRVGNVLTERRRFVDSVPGRLLRLHFGATTA